MRYRNFGPKGVIAGGFRAANGVVYADISGFPKSGTAGSLVESGTGLPTGSVVRDYVSGVEFFNEGSLASPYWTPTTFDQRGLLGWYSDFRDAQGVAVAGTAASTTLNGSGLRVHGQGIAEVADSGLTITMDDQGAVAALTTTDEDAHTAVISVGNGTTPVFQPDQNGTMVVDVNVTMDTNLTAKAAFLGFCGSAADALDPIMTYSGTTISFATTIGDDVAGLAWSSELTASARWFAPHDKDNANASIATTATGVDTGIDLVAGTYQRLRVECDANGTVRVFINKVLISTFLLALEVTEEVQPMFYVESSTTAIKQANLKHFAAWGKRV